MLKIYWNSPEIIIVEPSGKIHTSDINAPKGENIIDLTFMTKYEGQHVMMYFKDSNNVWVPSEGILVDVFVKSRVHAFNVQPL